jgi:hypothetical protein
MGDSFAGGQLAVADRILSGAEMQDGVAEVCYTDLDTLVQVCAATQAETVQPDSTLHSSAIHRSRLHEHLVRRDP